MSRAAALIWLLIALLLSGIVWWTRPRATIESAATPLLADFSPGNVTAVGVEWPDGQRLAVQRSPIPGRWLMRVATPSGPSLTWPIDSERIQGLLRILSESRRQTAAEARAMPAAIFLTIESGGKPAVRIAIDPNTLGGSGRAALVSPEGTATAVGSIDESFVRALDRSAVDAWRSRDVLFWSAESSDTMTSRAGDDLLQLAKAGGSWMVQAPMLSRADAGVVQGSLLFLSKATIERFVPPEAVRETDWSKAERRITIGTSLRPAPDAPPVEVESIWEVGPAVSGQSHAVRMLARQSQSGAVLWGPQFAVLDNAVLRAVPQKAESVLSKITAEFPAADVSAIELTCASGTSRIGRDASGTFGTADATARELLKLLTESPAAQIRLLQEDEPAAEEIVGCRLLGLRDQPLASVKLRASVTPSKVAGAPAATAVEVRDGDIVRLVPWTRPGELLASVKSLCKPGGN